MSTTTEAKTESTDAEYLGAPVAQNGATGTETPVEQPNVEAKQNANGTAPATGQTQAAENDKDKKEAATKQAAAKQALDEQKAAKDKEIADKHAADKLWGEWKPKAAEGITRDEAAMKEAVPLFRELGLNPDQSQKLLDLSDKFQAAQVKQAHAYAAQVDAKNHASLKAEYGDKFDTALRVANKVIDRFGTPELKAKLADPVLRRDPDFFRFFNKLGIAMADDKLADGAGLGGGRTPPKGQMTGLYDHPTSQRRR